MTSIKKRYLTAKDHTVSKEEFDLLYNNELGMLETSPIPKAEDLAAYYKSTDYISHTDSNKSITDKLYQLVKKVTLQKKLTLINSFKTENKNLLDVGCGTGDFLVTCKNNDWNVTGIEPNSKAQKIARDKLQVIEESTIFINLSEAATSNFDVITLWHVLEHVPNLNSYIKNLKSLLKPNGVLIVAVPNFKSYDAIYYKQFWAAFDVPRHLWHFSKKAIQLLFSKQKMKIIKTLPMKFDSFYISLLSEKYKNGKVNYLKAFFIGLISNIKAIRSKEYSSLIYVIKNTEN